MERNHLCNYGRGHYKEHFYEKRLNLDQLFVQEVMSLKEGSYLEFGSPLIRRSKTHSRFGFIMTNIVVKLV